MQEFTFSCSTQPVDPDPIARAILSGKRIAIAGFSPQDALQVREVLEGFEALCRILRDDAAGSINTAFDLAVLRHSRTTSLTEQAGSLPRLVIGHYAELCGEISGLGSPGQQFMLLPGSAQELVIRAAAALGAVQKAVPTDPAKPTVVLADDDPSITALLKATLSRQHIVCHVAHDGARALALTRELRPQAVVLDVNMPHTDGFEVLSSLRNDPATRGIRVLMLTGCEQETDVLRGFGLGTDDYVTKPFNPIEVAARVKRLLGISS